jgi:hypothetical protein
MVLDVDNEGAKDLCDKWNVGGRTGHVEVKQMFLREVKESKVIVSSYELDSWRRNNDDRYLHQEFARSVIREGRSQIC